jgi:Cu/Ag efflux protein CusF
MLSIRRHQLTLLVGTLLCTLLVSMTVRAQDAKKEHAFRGVVQKVDAKNKSLTVDGENVPGWMTAMTMSYSPDKEDIFKTVKVGDQITAKVHDGDMKTLYGVKIVPPAKDAPKK